MGGEEALLTLQHMLHVWKNHYECQTIADCDQQSEKRSDTRSVFQLYTTEMSDKDSSTILLFSIQKSNSFNLKKFFRLPSGPLAGRLQSGADAVRGRVLVQLFRAKTRPAESVDAAIADLAFAGRGVLGPGRVRGRDVVAARGVCYFPTEPSYHVHGRLSVENFFSRN